MLADHGGELLHDEPSDRGCQLTGFVDDAVAGGECRHDGPARGVDGPVPGPDDADDPVRLVGHGGGLVRGEQAPRHPARAQDAPGMGSRPGEDVKMRTDLQDGLVDGFAVLLVDQVRELVKGVVERPLPGQQARAATVEAEAGPPLGGGARVFDHGAHLVGAVRREGRDRRAGNRADRVKGLHRRHDGRSWVSHRRACPVAVTQSSSPTSGRPPARR